MKINGKTVEGVDDLKGGGMQFYRVYYTDGSSQDIDTDKHWNCYLKDHLGNDIRIIINKLSLDNNEYYTSDYVCKKTISYDGTDIREDSSLTFSEDDKIDAIQFLHNTFKKPEKFGYI